jgi:hypothetical protein
MAKRSRRVFLDFALEREKVDSCAAICGLSAPVGLAAVHVGCRRDAPTGNWPALLEAHMTRGFTLACLALAASFAAAPAEAQYYHQPGPGYYQPQPQIYLPPGQVQRNMEKLSRKQAEFYQRYGYPQPQPRYRQPPQYHQPYGYAPPQRQYRRPPPQYYYYD